jgi:TatD DNase family protein
MFIDSHCHLNLEPLKDNLDHYIKQALEAKVSYMQTICTKLEDIDDLIAIATKYDQVFASVGIHPNEALKLDDTLTDQLINLYAHPKIIGLGETGLDYYRNHNDPKVQKVNFIAHIHAAQETQLPIIIHARDADEHIIDILQSEMRNKPFKGLIHCFTGSKELAFQSLDLGLYISLAGVITFNNAKNLQEIVASLPIHSLLIETDAPYLAPVPHRGGHNQPAYVAFVAEKLASLFGMDVKTIAEYTTNSFKKLFTKTGL